VLSGDPGYLATPAVAAASPRAAAVPLWRAGWLLYAAGAGTLLAADAMAVAKQRPRERCAHCTQADRSSFHVVLRLWSRTWIAIPPAAAPERARPDRESKRPAHRRDD
jgi:hypothetical protein